MDITPLFKACVKTISTRNKALGITSQENEKSRILPAIRGSTEMKFHSLSKEVLSNVTKLKDFLLENRKAYLSTSSQFLRDEAALTDTEREEIDRAAQHIVKTCAQLIQEFKKEHSKVKGNSQTQAHRQVVTDLLDNYLKAVCKLYSEQRAIHVKRRMELQRMTNLEPNTVPARKAATEKASGNEIGNNQTDTVKPRSQSFQDLEEEESRATTSWNYGLQDEPLSAEEQQMLELENAQLFNELNSLNEEVRQLQGRVIKIAELQQTFTEKVLEQEKDIDRIATTTVGATENIKEGNEQLRQAMQNNAGLRVAILFFIIVMSFSLLFLDWYND